MQNNLFKKVLKDSAEGSMAVAAINILNHITGRAVVQAAERAGRPVIIQPSAGTVKRYGVGEFTNMANGLKAMVSVPVVLHLDHCTDAELSMACIKAGWDSVMVDYSARSFDENVEMTKRIVDFAHSRQVAVEGEIGIISGVDDRVVHMASLEDTVAFIEKTGIDAVAPAIGTAHGTYTEVPKLNFQLVEELRKENVPIVVHGGTGLPEKDFQKLIACGASKINISTVLKKAYLGACRFYLEDSKIAPVDFDTKVEEHCSLTMEKFIRLFANEEVQVYDSKLSR